MGSDNVALKGLLWWGYKYFCYHSSRGTFAVAARNSYSFELASNFSDCFMGKFGRDSLGFSCIKFNKDDLIRCMSHYKNAVLDS